MDFKRLFDILPYQAQRYPQKIALAERKGNKWKSYTTEECLHKINALSAGAIELGLAAGDKVGIMTTVGSPAWNFIDLGMQQLGIIVVPIHASISTSSLEFILKDSEVKLCFVESRELYESLLNAQKNCPSLKKIFTTKRIKGLAFWEEIMKKPTEHHLQKIKEGKTRIEERDLATIIYTSGTTGQPKGVMLSHRNIVSNIKATISMIPIDYQKTTISFLPMSHIFERMATYTYMAVGASIHYVEKVDTIVRDLKEVKPHYFTSVPRLLERMYDGILEQANTQSALTKRILLWALTLGERYEPQRKAAPLFWLKRKFADLLVYRRWRQVLGGRVEGVMVGAAALQAKLGQLFSAAGIEIREGYGLTETSPVIAFNRFEPGGVRYGTVGIVVPGVELKIEEDGEVEGEGEILVRGPNLMMGYYKKPELNAEVIDEEGWFHTGDIGKIVHKRFLQITDRKKDIFKTSSGKYVAPQKLENLLKSNRFISQCMITGFNRPYVAALIIPNFVHLERWCKINDVHWTSPQYMTHNPKVMDFMKQQVRHLNQELEKETRIRRIYLLHEEWSVAGGEYAQTLKLRRPFILDKFQKEVEEMYESKGELI